MYSTLLFLDRPRHLRYDMRAIMDLDQLLLGGFNSVFMMEADMEALRLIYWAGLKHEDMHLRIMGEGGTGDILQNAMVSGPWNEGRLVRQFTKAMINDGWIGDPDKKETVKDSEDSNTEPFTVQDYVHKMETLNYEYLGLSPDDFYGITPREFNLMMDVAGQTDNWRFGTLCATVANCSGAKKHGSSAFAAEDFFHIRKKVVVESQKTIENKMRAAFGSGG